MGPAAWEVVSDAGAAVGRVPVVWEVPGGERVSVGPARWTDAPGGCGKCVALSECQWARPARRTGPVVWERRVSRPHTGSDVPGDVESA
ncbi:hypothetical protein GCM10027072_53010 [Streptomyces bullii]